MASILTRAQSLRESQNKRWALIGAVGLAMLAALLAFVSLRAAGGSGGSTAVVGDTSVVVTTRDIKAGSLIPADALKLQAVPKDAAIAGALPSLDGIAGRVARVGLAANEQLTDDKISKEGSSDNLGNVVPQGRRGIPVSVSEEKVFGGLLKPGDHVDVIGVISPSSSSETEAPTAQVLAQNVEVIAVADKSLVPTARVDANGAPIATDNAAGTIGQAPSNTDAQPDARVVTLNVTPQDELGIILAQEQGSVWLVLRGPGDDAVVPLAPQTLVTP